MNKFLVLYAEMTSVTVAVGGPPFAMTVENRE